MTRRHFLLPDVGEGLTEAEIVTWKVKVGDTVTLNQPLVDIETAKATVELPSPYAGTVAELHGAIGDVVPVGAPLIEFDVAGDAPDDVAPPAAPPAAPVPAEGSTELPHQRTAVLVGYGVSDDAPAVRSHRRRGAERPVTASVPTGNVAPVVPLRAVRSTPPVRLYAKQHGVDIAAVRGSGPEGLVTRRDVEDALQGSPGPRPSAPTTTTKFVGHELAPWDEGPAEERIPVRGVLRSMAEAMVQSAFTAPHAAAWLRVDATNTIELLEALRQRPTFKTVRLSPMTIVAMALCDAARHYPGINSSFDSAASEVIVRRKVNLGIAADTPRGLMVPNIKQADRLDLVAMASAINELVDRARAGTSTPAEMVGTTMTITNVGPFGIDGAMPILPPGTAAILAMGAVAKAPWVVNDEIVVRHVVEIALSFDHRMIDGALASRVLAHVGDYLRDPAPRLIAG
jgi:pyruvate dehydrogenase E2 component (dihydrolipoamide acetyltransferase)